MKSLKDRKIYELHAQVCQTLSNPKRLEILNLLREGERSVNELARLMGISQANTSQHLIILRQRGIVHTSREGVNVYYRIANPKIIQAFDLLREVLLDRLAEEGDLAKAVQSWR